MRFVGLFRNVCGSKSKYFSSHDGKTAREPLLSQYDPQTFRPISVKKKKYMDCSITPPTYLDDLKMNAAYLYNQTKDKS